MRKATRAVVEEEEAARRRCCFGRIHIRNVRSGEDRDGSQLKLTDVRMVPTADLSDDADVGGVGNWDPNETWPPRPPDSEDQKEEERPPRPRSRPRLPPLNTDEPFPFSDDDDVPEPNGGDSPTSGTCWFDWDSPKSIVSGFWNYIQGEDDGHPNLLGRLIGRYHLSPRGGGQGAG